MVTTEKPTTNFNRALLSSFARPTKKFEEFIVQRVSAVHLPESIFKERHNELEVIFKKAQSKNQVNVVEKIYRKLVESCFDYVIVCRKNITYNSINIIFCKKSNYKQALFNVRSKNINNYKSFINKSNISKNHMLSMIQTKKVKFSKNFIVSVYGLKEDQYATYKPFDSVKNGPKKKHLMVKTPEFKT